jgi:hypothetical protein
MVRCSPQVKTISYHVRVKEAAGGGDLIANGAALCLCYLRQREVQDHDGSE